MGLRQLSIGVSVLAVLLYFLLPFEWINSRYVQVKTVRDLQPQYEYIIVGGGVAGILVASRLSSDPNVFVLLLEAGDQIPWFAHSPYFRYLFDSNKISYGWNVTLSSHNNEHERWDYWRVLGGSGASGNSFYDVPSTSEWDTWAEDRQLLDVWSSNTIDAAFISARNAAAIDAKVRSLTIDSMTEKLRNAAIAEGFRIADDITKKEKIGFSSAFYWRKSDDRSASVLDYLAPEVQSRFNLHILSGARATKIAFDLNGMATGVSYIYEGRLHRVLVNREVVLSAGVIGSPHLLLLSGIGSEEQLQQFSITPIRSLPAVGEQLAGPLSATIHYDTDQDCSTEMNNSFVDWITATLCQNLDSIRFVQSICNRREDSLRKLPTVSATLSTSTANKNSNADFYVTFSPYCSQSKWAISAQVSLLNSYRSGSIRLQSSDASLPPIIEMQSREPFIDLLTKVALRIHSLFMMDSFAKLGIRTSRWQHKECDDEPSERFFSCLIAKSRADLFPSHTSSCAMGNMLTNSVVDKYLRVHGVKRLRVVDASVLPPIASVKGALSSVLMLAERAAKIISDAYRNTS
uniref:Uncharacterized protein n=1 Tax=Parascaris univalens TaxID=6257 RepID=A0A915CAT4_PARUN